MSPATEREEILAAAAWLESPGSDIAARMRQVADTGPGHPEWADAVRIARCLIPRKETDPR